MKFRRFFDGLLSKLRNVPRRLRTLRMVHQRDDSKGGSGSSADLAGSLFDPDAKTTRTTTRTGRSRQASIYLLEEEEGASSSSTLPSVSGLGSASSSSTGPYGSWSNYDYGTDKFPEHQGSSLPSSAPPSSHGSPTHLADDLLSYGACDPSSSTRCLCPSSSSYQISEDTYSPCHSSSSLYCFAGSASIEQAPESPMLEKAELLKVRRVPGACAILVIRDHQCLVRFEEQLLGSAPSSTSSHTDSATGGSGEGPGKVWFNMVPPAPREGMYLAPFFGTAAFEKRRFKGEEQWLVRVERILGPAGVVRNVTPVSAPCISEFCVLDLNGSTYLVQIVDSFVVEEISFEGVQNLRPEEYITPYIRGRQYLARVDRRLDYVPPPLGSSPASLCLSPASLCSSLSSSSASCVSGPSASVDSRRLEDRWNMCGLNRDAGAGDDDSVDSDDENEILLLQHLIERGHASQRRRRPLPRSRTLSSSLILDKDLISRFQVANADSEAVTCDAEAAAYIAPPHSGDHLTVVPLHQVPESDRDCDHNQGPTPTPTLTPSSLTTVSSATVVPAAFDLGQEEEMASNEGSTSSTPFLLSPLAWLGPSATARDVLDLILRGGLSVPPPRKKNTETDYGMSSNLYPRVGVDWKRDAARSAFQATAQGAAISINPASDAISCSNGVLPQTLVQGASQMAGSLAPLLGANWFPFGLDFQGGEQKQTWSDRDPHCMGASFCNSGAVSLGSPATFYDSAVPEGGCRFGNGQYYYPNQNESQPHHQPLEIHCPKPVRIIRIRL